MKTIMFLTGYIPECPNEGHSYYSYKLIERLSKRYRCIIVGKKVKAKGMFDDLASQCENVKYYDLVVNSKLKCTAMALLTFSPLAMNQLLNRENIKLLAHLTKMENVSVVHGIYFPTIGKLLKSVKHPTKVLSVPDLYSSYYKQLFCKTKNTTFLYNYLTYTLWEWKYRSSFFFNHYVSFQDAEQSILENAVVYPLMLPDDAAKNEMSGCDNLKNEVLVPRLNIEDSLIVLDQITTKMPYVKFTFLSKHEAVITRIKSGKYENVKIFDWVDDYEIFAKDYKVHLLMDKCGTGQSTRTSQALKNGNIVIGTEKTYRGLFDFPKNYKNVYASEEELIDLIKRKICLNREDYLSESVSLKEYILDFMDNDKIVAGIEEQYRKIV